MTERKPGCLLREQPCWHQRVEPETLCVDCVNAALALEQGAQLRYEAGMYQSLYEVAKARIEELEAALRECIDLLMLVEHPRPVDPDFGSEVNELGQRIGFGALMSSASASWRATLAAKGWPLGSEFVAGPCQASVNRILQFTRTTLSKGEGGKP